MKGALLFGLSLVVAAAAVAAWKQTQKERPEATRDPSLAPERKDEIRRFWEAYRRATELKQQGDWEAAAVAYLEALQINPRHEDALYYLGNASLECERYAEAVNAWRRLVEVNPLSSRAHIQLGVVHSCAAPGAPFDLNLAEKELQRALAINKEESGPIVKLGEVALLKGDEQRALAHFAAASRTNFKSVEAHYLAGYIYWRRSDRAAALVSLRKALELCRADTVVPGVAGEGDTRKKAARPLLSESVSSLSFFGPFLAALPEWSDTDISEAGMNEEYTRLQAAVRGFASRRSPPASTP